MAGEVMPAKAAPLRARGRGLAHGVDSRYIDQSAPVFRT